MRVSVAIRRAKEAASAGGRIRYPGWLRSKTVGYYERRAQAGVDMREVAAEIGLSTASLRRWVAESRYRQSKQATPQESGFVPVTVASESTEQPETRLVVRGPMGLQIEGLDLDGVVELLRRVAE